MPFKDDYLILGAWFVVPFIAIWLLSYTKVKFTIPYIILSVLIFGASVASGIYSQYAVGEGAMGLAILSLVTGISFLGLQIGAGTIWLIRRVRTKKAMQTNADDKV